MFLFHPDHQVPLPPGHRFPMGKYAATRAALHEAWPEWRAAETSLRVP
ncbi:MAG: hypothetical protein SNJ63_06730 [Sphingomonadaceae bacterium]